MNIILVILCNIFIIGIGYLIILIFKFGEKMDQLSSMVYSYGLGVGVISAQLFFYSLMQIYWNRYTLLIPWFVIAVTLFFFKKKKIHFYSPKIIKIPKINLILILLILVTFGYTAFEATLRPVSVWDAWAMWLLDSKIFFIDTYINPHIFAYIRSDYPLTVSLLGTYVYIFLGHIDDTTVLLTSTTFYVLLCILFFTSLRNFTNKTYALFFTFLLVTIQVLIRQGGRLEAGQADLPLGYYIFCSTILFFEYIKKRDYKYIILVGIFLCISCLIKDEGIPFAIVLSILAAYHIFKKKIYSHLLFILLWGAPLLGWEIYKHYYTSGFGYFDGHKIEFSVQKMVNAFSGTFLELINIKSWAFLWITYFYLLIMLPKTLKFNRNWILHALIITQLSIYILLYVFTSANAPDSSIERLLVHIAPLALFYIASEPIVIKYFSSLISSMKRMKMFY